MFSFLLNNKGEWLTALDFIRGEFDIVLLDRGSVQGANLSHLFGFVKKPKDLACLLLIVAVSDTVGRKERTRKRRQIHSLNPNSNNPVLAVIKASNRIEKNNICVWIRSFPQCPKY